MVALILDNNVRSKNTILCKSHQALKDRRWRVKTQIFQRLGQMHGRTDKLSYMVTSVLQTGAYRSYVCNMYVNPLKGVRIAKMIFFIF